MNQPKAMKALLWAGAALCAVVIALLSIFALLQTGKAKALIASKLSTLLSEEPDRYVVIEELQGLIPLRMRIKRITVKDSEGPWISAQNLALSWRPSSLLAGRIHIDEIAASSLNLERLPSGVQKEEDKSEPFKAPAMPPLVINRLAVSDLAIGKAVAGQEAHFQLEGRLLEEADKPGAAISLRLERKDKGPATRIEIKAAPRSEPPALQVRAEFFEEDGGLAAALLGVKDAGAIRIVLDGDGPPKEWKGDIEGAIEKVGSFHADILARAGDEGIVTLWGGYTGAPSALPPALTALLGSDVRFGFSVRPVEPHAVAIENVDIQGKGSLLKLSGKLDYELMEIESRWSLGIDDISALEQPLQITVAGSLMMEGRLFGAVDAPQAKISAQLKRFHIDRVSADEVSMDYELQSLAGADSGKDSLFEIKGSGSVKKVEIAGEKPFAEDSLKWTFETHVPKGGDISIRSFRIESVGRALEAKGRVNPEDLSGALDASIRLKDMKPIGVYPGEAELEGSISFDAREGSASGSVKGRLVGLDKLAPRYASLLGPGLSIGGSFDLRNKNELTAPSLRIESPAFRFDGNVATHIADRTLKGSWKLSAPKLEPFSAIVERPLSGSLDAEGVVEGSLDALKSTSSVKVANVAVNGLKFNQLLLDAAVRNIPKAPEGNLRLQALQGDQKINASTDFRLDDRKLALAKIAMSAPGSNLTGNLILDFDGPAVDGGLEGKFKDLSAIGRMFGEKMEGNGELKARFLPDKSGQGLNLDVKGSGITTGYGKVNAIGLSADLKNILKTPQGKAALQLTDFHRPDVTIKSLHLEASGDEKGMSLEGAAKGKWRDDFELQAKGTLLPKDAYSLRLGSLKGRMGEYALNLLQPVYLKRSGEDFAVEKIALAIGDGRIDASGRLAPRSISLVGDFEKLPLGMLASLGGPEIKGSAAGRLRFEGSPSKPSGNFDIKLSDLKPVDPAQRSFRDAVLAADGKLEGNSLGVNFQLARQEKIPLKGSLGLPVAFSFSPFSFSIPPAGALRGNIEARTDLSIITAFFPLDGHDLRGNVAGSADISGSVAEPDIRGSIRIENGSYENYRQGAVLKKLAAEMTTRGGRLEIDRISATDGERGSVSLSGWVNLTGHDRFALDLSGAITKARLIRRDDLAGIVSGDLRISGSLSDMALAGRMEVESAEYNIPKRFRTSVARLNVIEINGPEASSAKDSLAEDQKERAEPLKLGLNLGVSIPGRALVRGRGLNSEWEGNLKIGGSSSAPSITGELSIVRGHYDFLGERFNLANGVIHFYGESPPAPVLDVTAEAKAADVTARLLLSGPVSNPKINLESDPPLPSDEILSRVLFNRNMSQISPLQAVKLANAVRTLSGHGDTLDFMEKARDVLGVEQLELRESDVKQGEYAVGIGKYLTEDVYVDVEKGVGNETGKASIKIELRPNLTLESEAGMDAGKGVGLNWKRDY